MGTLRVSVVSAMASVMASPMASVIASPMGRVIGLVIAMGALATACGASAPPPTATLSSTWAAPTLLSHVPADSPYVFASLEPVSDAVRKRMLFRFDQQIAPLVKLAEKAKDPNAPPVAPWLRGVLAIVSELRGKDPQTWNAELGIDRNHRFVLYGLSIWPVLRLEVAEPARLRAVVERATAAAGVQLIRATLGAQAYWTAGNSERTMVAAVLDHEAVVAVLPTPAVTAMLPLVLGSQLPPNSLAATGAVPDVLGRHRLLSYLFGYVDTHALVDVFAGRRQGQPGELDAPVRALTGPVPPDCGSDLDRLAAAVPRFVFGYRRVDETGFDGIAMFETPAGIAGGLQRLHSVVPEVVAPQTAPLFAMGVAIKPDELVSWLRGLSSQVHEHPFTCRWLTKLNDAGSDLARALDKPLPPMLHGLRGFALAIDDARSGPLRIAGHLLVFGDLVKDLLSLLPTPMALIGIPLRPDGRVIELPERLFAHAVSSAHAAMSTDRLVIAAGPDSAQQVTDHLASPAPQHSPLLVMAMDGQRLRQVMTAFGSANPDGLAYLGNFGVSVEAVDDGLSFDIWGTWPAASAAPALEVPRAAAPADPPAAPPPAARP